METKENYDKEEWGGWKIVSEMLDHPDENGIYPTSKCYQKLYEFVVAQKDSAYRAGVEKCIEAVPKGFTCRYEMLEKLEALRK